MSFAPLQTVAILGSPISVCTESAVVQQLLEWAEQGQSKVVCICNVHSVVTASRDADFARVLAEADLATPDGAPIAWMMRKLGVSHQHRVSGPDLMLACCKRAAESGLSVYLLGSTDATLSALATQLQASIPALQIAGMHSPPFRSLSKDEDEAIIRAIHVSGAKLVWVSLGCPKQETWMAEHRNNLMAVMVGVGAAFDFHAGLIKRAPLWMRNAGLEWLHRLLQEPRRLWRRYLITNSVFIFGALMQLIDQRQHRHRIVASQADATKSTKG